MLIINRGKIYLLIVCSIVFCLAFSSCQKKEVEKEVFFQTTSIDVTGVIVTSLASFYKDKECINERELELLYLTPVSVIKSYEKSYLIKLEDGKEGYINKRTYKESKSSLEQNIERMQILVSGDEKVIYEDATGRKPIIKIYTGTILNVKKYHGDWVEVFLEDNRTGFMTINNILDIEDGIAKMDAEYFVKDVLRFNNVPYKIGGTSISQGADMLNCIVLCGKLNGVNIPYDIDKIIDRFDEVNDSEYMLGDLLFFAKNRFENEITELAVCVGDERVLAIDKENMVIKVQKMIDNDFRNRLRKVIRIY